MVDFNKLREETPEQRAARQERIQQEQERQDRERRDLISDLCDADGLTDWETNFVDSVERYLNLHGYLTEKQETTLRKIHKERCS